MVACIRAHWRGLSGGDRAWREIAAFFDELRHDAVPMHREQLDARTFSQEAERWNRP